MLHRVLKKEEDIRIWRLYILGTTKKKRSASFRAQMLCHRDVHYVLKRRNHLSYGNNYCYYHIMIYIVLYIYNSIYRVYINFDSLFSFLFEFCCCCLFRNYFSKTFFSAAVSCLSDRGRKSKEKCVRRNKGVSIRNFFLFIVNSRHLSQNKKKTKNYNTIF